MDIYTPRDIGALIRERRRELGLDQTALAKRAGVSRLWIGQIEQGKPGAGIGLVLRTLRELGITLSVAESAASAQTQLPFTDLNAIVEAARGVSRK